MRFNGHDFLRALPATHLAAVPPGMARLVAAAHGTWPVRRGRGVKSWRGRPLRVPPHHPCRRSPWHLGLTASLFLTPPAETPLPVRLFASIDQMAGPLAASAFTAPMLVAARVLAALDRI